ncbi:MAG TPA: protein kinase [Ktedonobacteraceae bacterium]
MTAILPLEAGALVGGQYQIEGLINTGGFGSVYRGVALSEGNRPCAIKETYDVTPAARRQALMEAAILFTVKNEHLPQVYDAFEEKGRFYLAMQLIEGQNCAQMVKGRGGPFSEQEVLNWFLPLVDVLQELHGRNPPVLHRDIKPANVIITPRGRAVLVDFGLTRLYDPNVQTQTMARAVSEGFSPLEQYIGQTSPQSDLYSLAATMYFLLTAQVPAASVARSMQDSLLPPRQINPQISPKLERALLRALSLNVDERQVSMQEFARAIREPGFSSYAEPTVSQTRHQNASAQTELVAPPPPPPLAPARAQAGQGRAYPAVPGQARPPVQPAPAAQAGRRVAGPVSGPVPGWNSAPAGPQVHVGSSGRAIPPPAGGTLTPTHPPVPLQRGPLPRPFQQGCLWGLLQGIISSALLLLAMNDSVFYWGIAEGLLFYLLAGFFTTRRGGRATRSLRAGFWAGIFSTIFYWLAMLLGLLIKALPLVQRIVNESGATPGEALRRAISRVAPPILRANVLNISGQGLRSTLILAAIGLACAMVFALLGGLLGSRYANRS